MNTKIAAGLLGLSILFSGWLYWGSDLKVEQILTSQEWQSNMVTVIDTQMPEEAVGPVKKGTLIANVKYLQWYLYPLFCG